MEKIIKITPLEPEAKTYIAKREHEELYYIVDENDQILTFLCQKEKRINTFSEIPIYIGKGQFIVPNDNLYLKLDRFIITLGNEDYEEAGGRYLQIEKISCIDIQNMIIDTLTRASKKLTKKY